MRQFLMAGTFLLMMTSAALAQTHVMNDPELAGAQKAMNAGQTAQALNLFKDAAASGNSTAMEHVAQIYLSGGSGVRQDYSAAREWAQKAADAGKGRGNTFLGQIWMNGWGVAADLDKALAHFEQASAQGDMKAGRYIGLIAQKRGDHVAAAKSFLKAAEAGDITSLFYIGRAYEFGTGVPLDYAKAMEWYTKSASRGDIIASDGMVGMAGLYETGKGVPQDLDHAVEIYRGAAELGNASAIEALARLGL